VTDIFDRATEIEEATREDALEKQKRRSGLDGKTHEDSAIFCRRCTGKIPDVRRHSLPGVQTCVECQRDIEAEQ
jgi:phage/conjugal plasmid C-4 type zinc finger TraR family protein